MRTHDRLPIRLFAQALVFAAALAPTGAALAQSVPYYAAPRYRLVGTMLSSAQVLIWDERAGQYQLNRPGDVLDGMRIIAIEPDRLLLDRGGRTVALMLAPTPRRQLVPRPAYPTPAPMTMQPPVTPQQQVQSPPVAPQPEAQPQPEMQSPPVAAQPEVPPPPVALQPQVQPRPEVQPQPEVPPPTVAPQPEVPPTPIAPTPQSTPITISRDEFESELGDFGKLAQEVVLAPMSSGGYRLDALRPGCYLERLGLRAGDVVLAIDGRAINEPDDAARAYAWLQVTDHFTVDLLRDGSRLRLSYRIAGASASL